MRVTLTAVPRSEHVMIRTLKPGDLFTSHQNGVQMVLDSGGWQVATRDGGTYERGSRVFAVNLETYRFLAYSTYSPVVPLGTTTDVEVERE